MLMSISSFLVFHISIVGGTHDIIGNLIYINDVLRDQIVV